MQTELLFNTLFNQKPPVFIRFGRSITNMASEPTRTPQAILTGGGVLWTGWIDVPEVTPSQLWLLSITGVTGWFEVRWSVPSTAVGVQFWGDNNDGYASVLVDGEEAWRGNIWGDIVPYDRYLSITGLPNRAHTVRVVPLGEPGRNGGDVHVTVAGVGCGPVPETNVQPQGTRTLYMPLVNNANDESASG